MHSDLMSRRVFAFSQVVFGADRGFQWLVAMAILIAVTGCGGGSDELNRVEIHGGVTVNGVPVKAGRVNFIPERGTRGPASGSQIIAGKFTIHRDRGPVPGKYLVRVQIEDLGAAADSGGAAVELRPPTKAEVLAGKDEPQPEASGSKRSESGSALKNQPQDTTPEFHVSVTAGGPNNFDLAAGSQDAGTQSESNQDGTAVGNE